MDAHRLSGFLVKGDRLGALVTHLVQAWVAHDEENSTWGSQDLVDGEGTLAEDRLEVIVAGGLDGFHD